MARRTVTTTFTSVSWIPSEAMVGLMKLPMDVGLGHYDGPPPDRIDDIEAFVAADEIIAAQPLMNTPQISSSMTLSRENVFAILMSRRTPPGRIGSRKVPEQAELCAVQPQQPDHGCSGC